MEIRKAVAADLEQMLEIVAQAQAFLRVSGVDQWQDGYPTRDILLRDIEAGEMFLLADAEQIMAFAALIFGGERDYARIYDGAWHGDGAYLTIHRVATNATLRQTGAASRLLAYGEQLCRECGAGMIRIDTHNDNRAMQGMLKKNGFAYCGKVILSGGEERVAFDKLLNG